LGEDPFSPPAEQVVKLLTTVPFRSCLAASTERKFGQWVEFWVRYLVIHFLWKQKWSRQEYTWSQGQRKMSWSGVWKERGPKMGSKEVCSEVLWMDLQKMFVNMLISLDNIHYGRRPK
jgi:hypothetical protein